MEGNALVIHGGHQPVNILQTVTGMKNQVQLIQHVMRDVMKDGEHYGIIKGCGNKPCLLKAGAEKLAFTFHFAVKPEVEVVDLGGGHREYRVTVSVNDNTGAFLGTGVGCCSTLEGKWRFRTGAVELTNKVVPKEYWDNRNSDPEAAQKALGGKGYSAKKGDNGTWYIAIAGEKVEHDNPADYWNTCLKMAKKRALVDAILTVTAASDLFTQDIDDNPELYGATSGTVGGTGHVPDGQAPYQGGQDKGGKGEDKGGKKEDPKKETKKGADTKKETKKADDPPPRDYNQPATYDEIQAFWGAISALSEFTGTDQAETVTQLTKGNVDPLAADEAPAMFIIAATKKARDLVAANAEGDQQ